MIFYFSGTGNSMHAARVIAEAQGEELISIAQEFDKPDNKFDYKIKENELLGFVFPVYAWAPPKMVLKFVSRMKLSGSKPYVFTLSTCGDEEGNATSKLKGILNKKGVQLNNTFSICMPNNYIVGFDVDSKEVEKSKLEKAEQKIKEITAILINRQDGINKMIPGSMPRLKTAIINPLFNQFAMNTKQFYATDACTKCKICEKVCPVHTIKVTEKPTWSKECTQCLACINRCPVKAIQYGKGTIKKGRYINPDLR